MNKRTFEFVLNHPHIYSILLAQEDWSIGNGEKLLFTRKEIPSDMDHFVKVTTRGPAGLPKPIVMGRKTWDTLKGPLENRLNVVISENVPACSPEGVLYFNDPFKALRELRGTYPESNIGIIGGGKIYQQLFPYCDIIYLSKVKASEEVPLRTGDIFAKPPVQFKEQSKITCTDNAPFIYDSSILWNPRPLAYAQ